MAKKDTTYVCTECGNDFAKWSGQCAACGEWNTLKEFREAKSSKADEKKSQGLDLMTVEIPESTLGKEKFSSGISEVDRVLQEGFFPGSVMLLGGNPGVGKSTLALQLFLQQETAMYFSGEESREQVKARALRLGGNKNASKDALLERIFSSHALEDIITTIQKHQPALAVVDSIQMVGLSGAGLGNMQSIRENAELLVKVAKATGTALIIIGHVTKNDEIAGPKILEHVVDGVLYFEGDNETGLRMLRASKNRFGSTHEVGVFEMVGEGLKEVSNPSEYFLQQRPESSAGACISVVREGTRSFVIELQALTVKTNFGLPRRTSHGIDLSRVHLMLAVLSKFTAFPAENLDGYVNIVGGLKVKDPALDLALCAAFLSSRNNKPLPATTIVLGEVGLSGEIRSVGNLQQRLEESARLGFSQAYIPFHNRETIKAPKGMELVKLHNVGDLLKAFK